MGFNEAKQMIIICGIILIITNIFASNVSDLGNLKGVSGDVVNKVYNINNGQLSGDGTKMTEWMNSSDEGELEATNIFDFTFTSWSWVKNGIKMVWVFATAPYRLTEQMFGKYCTPEIDFLCIIKYLIGFIWTTYLALTLIQTIWGR